MAKMEKAEPPGSTCHSLFIPFSIPSFLHSQFFNAACHHARLTNLSSFPLASFPNSVTIAAPRSPQDGGNDNGA
jgi:hypothetical protein